MPVSISSVTRRSVLVLCLLAGMVALLIGRSDALPKEKPGPLPPRSSVAGCHLQPSPAQLAAPSHRGVGIAAPDPRRNHRLRALVGSRRRLPLSPAEE